MLKESLFCGILLLGAATCADAACTAEEAQAKAAAFQQATMEAAQKNPQKYQDAMTAMQKDLPAIQQNVNDMDSLCRFYDEWTAKMK
ncbi:MAG: BTB/POZ domain-containing protein KCTD2 [Desulfovibrio sp.]|nr:BTB/POZ domain-containing protein KCTD2 [Desulfovibrio sp.]